MNARRREESLLAALPGFIAHAKEHSAPYRKRLQHIDAAGVNSRDALAKLPPSAKSDMIGEQEQNPPFGNYDCFGKPLRFYLSPGPIAECDFAAADYWRTAAAFYALGLRAGMLVHNAFSYHFTPAGMMCDCGAIALGCRVFPAGPGNSEQQARAVARFRPDAYCGTPDFLRIILEKMDGAGLESPLRMASVSGGYLPPQLREYYQSRGIKTLQWYGSADFGVIAYESAADAPMIVAEGLLVEVVDPLTKLPCEEGQKGEVLVTNFNKEYPLIRFATGDLSAVSGGVSECGRTNMRLAGWLGRSDPATKVRGVFVHPVQVERIAARLDLAAAQLRVQSDENGRDNITLIAQRKDESGNNADNKALCEKLIMTLRDETGLRGNALVAKTIEGRTIEDMRAGEKGE
ncbi:MAG: phenylacetate--CoA ligase family protein [Gammaproteobacteria bacterium]